MNPEKLFTIEDAITLQQARKVYGAHKQIGIAAEECNELAKELIKSLRYDDWDKAVYNTKEHVQEEVADILIVLDHVINLYNITTEDLLPIVQFKMDRLRYWLQNSDSSEFTMEHRSIDTEAAGFEKYQTEYYGSLAVIDHPTVQEFTINTNVSLFDYNDEKYREDNE